MMRLWIITFLVIVQTMSAMHAATKRQVVLHEEQISRVMVQMEEDALTALLAGDLVAFDALAGDNSCRIRSAKIADLHDKIRVNVITTIDGVRLLLTSDEMRFLAISHLLTRCKTQVRHGDDIAFETIDEQALGRLGLGTDAVDKLKRRAQRELAELSIAIVQHEARQEPDLALALTHIMLDDPHFKRPATACFPGMKLLLRNAGLKQQPLVIKMQRRCTGCTRQRHELLFLVDTASWHCIAHWVDRSLQSGSCTDLVDRAAIVIDGISQAREDSSATPMAIAGRCQQTDIFAREFAQCKEIETVLLANAAQHPQFAGKNQHEQIPFAALGLPAMQQEFSALCQWASEHGCSLAAPTTLLIRHMFCSRLSVLLQEHLLVS